MPNTLVQLWNDHFKHSIENNISEKEELETLMQRNLKKLEENLDDKTKEVLEIYNDCINEYILLVAKKAFCNGFSLATRTTAEAFIGGR